MSRHLYILTGASRGLGHAMARQLLAGGHALLTLSRNPDLTLGDHAKAHRANLEQWAIDLGQVHEAVERFEIWLAQVEPGGLERVALINNAALLPTVVPLAELDGAELAKTIRVGLEAPMALTGAFLRVTEHWPCDRRVLNVSSGLGRRPMASQAAYCAVKAGMDHFTRCVALEEGLREHGARVCSLAPGVIDTDMQVHLRESNPQTFPDLSAFKLLKEHGALSTPEQAAAKVLARLMRDDFGAEPVADVRHD